MPEDKITPQEFINWRVEEIQKWKRLMKKDAESGKIIRKERTKRERIAKELEKIEKEYDELAERFDEPRFFGER